MSKQRKIRILGPNKPRKKKIGFPMFEGHLVSGKSCKNCPKIRECNN